MGGAGRGRGPGPHRRAGRGGDLTGQQRRRRSDAADAWCAEAFADAVPDPAGSGLALVAVGGYGRRELAPYSDLDVVLLHADGVDVSRTAGRIWYPLWDAGADLDHSVRALSVVTAAAARDVRVALGALDARHLAGDPSLTLQMRTTLLTAWRRDARRRLPELRRLVDRRVARAGELAHSTVPDLKDSMGGLRDATTLNALVATWLVDVPHTELARCRVDLLDVRDALQQVAGRATDRVAPEMWPDLAATLGLADASVAQRHVREAGRRIAHIGRLTWRRLEAVLAGPAPAREGRRPVLERVGPGLAVSRGEVVLDRGAEPARDPCLLLRAAAEAAGRNLVLAPATAARLARECPAVPEPWSPRARELFVRLLAAGPGLLGVWETLDETGSLDRLLPEWERVRLLPHASVLHRYTVDRHLVETCIEASRMLPRMTRPDLLVLAALLHDIGKGGPRDHSAAGAPVAEAVCRRMGFTAEDAALVGALVRHHLLLAVTATTRDVTDPATVRHVADRVPGRMMLDLLAVLTEADARATAPQAWTGWRSGLVADLVARVRDHLPAGEGAAVRAVRRATASAVTLDA